MLSGSPKPAELVPLGEWLRARRPFPQLRSALLDAEVLLNGYRSGVAGVAWQAVRDSVGDDASVVEALNSVFARLAPRPHVRLTASGPRLFLWTPGAHRELGAVCALAVLHDVSGDVRIKRCGRKGCDRVFVDWTNPNNRTACRFHPSEPARG